MSQLRSSAARTENYTTHTGKNYLGVPEPVPDWSKAKDDWGWAWPIHHYGFGLVFLVVGIYGMFLAIKHLKNPTRRPRSYFTCIAFLISFFGWTRATVLVLDPYTSHDPVRFPSGLGLIMFSIGYPCLTSGFFLINWSLIEVTKLQLLPSRIHQRKVLVLVLTVHFMVVILFDGLFSFFPSAYLLLFICRSLFVLWGLVLFAGFIFGGLRIQRQVEHNLLRLNTISQGDGGEAEGHDEERAAARNQVDNHVQVITAAAGSRARTRKVMKIARRAAGSGLLISCTQIYALWEFYVFYNDDIQPKVWPWWVYQTCFRLIELYMVSQMFVIVRQ